MYQELSDIIYHVEKQKININPKDMYAAFENMGYTKKEIYNAIWNVIECRIISDKKHKQLGYRKIEVRYENEN